MATHCTGKRSGAMMDSISGHPLTLLGLHYVTLLEPRALEPPEFPAGRDFSP